MTDSPRNINIPLILSGILEILGIAVITYGFYLIAPFAGFIIAGIGLLWIARGVDPPEKPLLPRRDEEDG